MDEYRKKVIIREINNWKQNRMLPEHYCDYLLNLYTEGNPEQLNKHGSYLSSWQLTVLAAMMLSLSVFLFYFTELTIILQIALVLIFGISSLVIVFFLLSKSKSELLPLLFSSIVLLVSTIQGASLLFPETPTMLYLVTAANCFLWLGIGTKRKLISFKISGAIGLIILAISIFI
ncbi:hypothetical protein [Bacillus sp. REN3]|uniref:hypothetical protein n=1 Tax=Bacillus sp. REN3 TaxID=2802440 RepID=UPI001AEE4D6E|nr:hypothetical protein [Bacillus sp. REN3]